VLDVVRVGASDLERGQDGMLETWLDYSLVGYTDGDVAVECSVGIGGAEAAGGASYYPAITKGATMGACIAEAQYETSKVGTRAAYWTLAIDAALPRAAYSDPDNPLGLNGYSYSFSDKDCHSATFGENGKWLAATLADVF
jgi:hypothetical protein